MICSWCATGDIAQVIPGCSAAVNSSPTLVPGLPTTDSSLASNPLHFIWGSRLPCVSVTYFKARCFFISPWLSSTYMTVLMPGLGIADDGSSEVRAETSPMQIQLSNVFSFFRPINPIPSRSLRPGTVVPPAYCNQGSAYGLQGR